MNKTGITINSRGKLNALMSNPSRIEHLQSLQIKAMIKYLPPNISQLKNLTNLSISSHKLRLLPSEIGLLIKLKTLNLSGCQLPFLPQEIVNLTALKKLNLSSNQFKVLPAGFNQLTNLELLDLRNNLIPNAKMVQLEWLMPETKIIK